MRVLALAVVGLATVGCTPRAHLGVAPGEPTSPAAPPAPSPSPDLPSPTPGAPAFASLAIVLPAALVAGGSAPLVATATDVSGATYDVSAAATWSSSDDAVLAVADGRVTAVAPGSAEVRATLGGLSQSATVAVHVARLEHLDIQPGAQAVPLGLPATVRAVGRYEDGSTQDLTARATWSTADATIAVADGTPGQIDTLAVGSTTVSARVGDATATATLTVDQPGLMSLLVIAGVPRPYDLPQQLIAIGTYSDGSTADLTATAVWTPMNARMARMDTASPGLIAASTSGVVTVEAAVGDVVGSADVIFTPKLLGITTDDVSKPLVPGHCRTVHTFFSYDDGSLQSADDSATWETSNAGVATVSNDLASVGLVCAVASGRVRLTVTVGVYAATTLVVVR